MAPWATQCKATPCRPTTSPFHAKSMMSQRGNGDVSRETATFSAFPSKPINTETPALWEEEQITNNRGITNNNEERITGRNRYILCDAVVPSIIRSCSRT